MPPHEPEPVTTIAWRLAHIIVGVFGARDASHFGGPPVDYEHVRVRGPAAAALASWTRATRPGSRACVGSGPTAWRSRAARLRARSPSTRWPGLVLHIHREVIHHGAEIALLRDLYHWRDR